MGSSTRYDRKASFGRLTAAAARALAFDLHQALFLNMDEPDLEVPGAAFVERVERIFEEAGLHPAHEPGDAGAIHLVSVQPRRPPAYDGPMPPKGWRCRKCNKVSESGLVLVAGGACPIDGGALVAEYDEAPQLAARPRATPAAPCPISYRCRNCGTISTPEAVGVCAGACPKCKRTDGFVAGRRRTA